MVSMRPSRRRRGVVTLALIVGMVTGVAVHAADRCGLTLTGTWKPATTTVGGEVVALEFSDAGRVTLLAGQPDESVRNYELIGAVEYELDEREPGQLAITASRGIEMFPRGRSLWEFAAHGDDGLALKRSGPDGARERLYSRERLKRYFLTFAARSDAHDGGPAAFAMWTELGARGAKREALGLHSLEREAGGAEREPAVERFGDVPERLRQAFAVEPDRDSDTMLRLELDASAYARTREILDAWNVLLEAGVLADDTPRLHAVELIEAVVESANRCVRTVVDEGEIDFDAIIAQLVAGEAADGRPEDAVRRLKARNERIHVDDKAFPRDWAPR